MARTFRPPMAKKGGRFGSYSSRRVHPWWFGNRYQPGVAEMSLARWQHGRVVVWQGRHDHQPSVLHFSSYLTPDASLGEAKLAEAPL